MPLVYEMLGAQRARSVESHLLGLDGDLAWLALLDLFGDDNLKDTVVELGVDAVMVDGSRELEAAAEAAIGALADPVARTMLTSLGHVVLVIGFGDALVLAIALGGTLVLNSGLFGARTVLGVGDARFAAFEGVLGVTLNGEGVVVGPLDVDVGLLDAGEFAVKLVGILGFDNVEARSEGAGVGGAAHLTGASGSVKLVGEVEEGGELVEAWEE